jgi:galactokinase
MTGGGFGGCTVNLVTRGDANNFSDALKSRYRQQFGIDADTYICEAVDGAMAARNKDAQGSQGLQNPAVKK